jgi:hypothetical protein
MENIGLNMIQFLKIIQNIVFFEIKGNVYYKFENEIKSDFKIIKISDCSFSLENDEIIDESKLTDLQKMLVQQKPYF